MCVCVRENRHLEGHDKVCEVKLGLQVQLDRHVLHTWKTKTTPTTQEINNEISLYWFHLIKTWVLKLSTHRRRFSFSHTLSLKCLQTLSAHVYELALWSRPHTNLINRELPFWIVLLQIFLFSKSYQLLCTSKTEEMLHSSCPVKDNNLCKPGSEIGHSVSLVRTETISTTTRWMTVKTGTDTDAPLRVSYCQESPPEGHLIIGSARRRREIPCCDHLTPTRGFLTCSVFDPGHVVCALDWVLSDLNNTYKYQNIDQ